MGLLKGSTTKQKEIKKTIAFFLEIVPTEKDDLTLRECILLPLRDKILKELRIPKVITNELVLDRMKETARKKLRSSLFDKQNNEAQQRHRSVTFG